MGAVDWVEPANARGSGDVARGVTKATTPPNGGGSFVFGFNSVGSSSGVAALRAIAPDFNPLTNGGAIRAAMKRAPSFVDGGFAPLAFTNLQSDDVTDDAYMIGLSDAEPARIVLRKGAVDVGLPDVDVGTDGVLARSSVLIPRDTWTYLRLDAMLQPGGDVLLTCYRADLARPLDEPPVWEAIPGMDPVTDPAIGALVGGFVGFGFRSEGELRKAAFFDQIEIYRQI